MDFLVAISAASRNDFGVFLDLEDDLQALLGRRVDLVERKVVEQSLRRRAILADAEPIYG